MVLARRAPRCAAVGLLGAAAAAFVPRVGFFFGAGMRFLLAGAPWTGVGTSGPAPGVVRGVLALYISDSCGPGRWAESRSPGRSGCWRCSPRPSRLLAAPAMGPAPGH